MCNGPYLVRTGITVYSNRPEIHCRPSGAGIPAEQIRILPDFCDSFLYAEIRIGIFIFSEYGRWKKVDCILFYRYKILFYPVFHPDYPVCNALLFPTGQK